MVSVIIPAYNEAGSIKDVVRKIRAALDPADYAYEIIVVDDGSTDGTAASLIGQDVVILTHPENKGYGASLKTGIRSAKGDVIVITDADGTYPPEMIPRLLGGMDEGYDMVVGARTGKDVNIPLLAPPGKIPPEEARGLPLGDEDTGPELRPQGVPEGTRAQILPPPALPASPSPPP